MAVLYTQHFFQGLDDNGDPLAGGLLYTYEAGTNTAKATYTTPDESVAHSNPIILDSAGRATIFLNGSYKFRLETQQGVLVDQTDNVTAFTTSANADIGDINGLDSATVAATDEFVFADVSDSNTNKKDTIQGILDLASSGWAPLQTQTVTTAVSSVDFTSNIDDTYDVYAIVLSDVIPATDGQSLISRLGNDGAFDSGASDYAWGYKYLATDATTVLGGRNSALSQINLTVQSGSASGEATHGIIYLYQPSNSSTETVIGTSFHYKEADGHYITLDGVGARLESAAHDRIQFFFSSGNISSGTFTLYGIKDA